MVQQANALALFYATLSQTESAKKKGKKKTVQAREKGWKTRGNETHNLPPLFIERKLHHFQASPVENNWKPMGKSTNPRNNIKKITQYPHKTLVDGELACLKEYASVIICIISFLSRRDLITTATTSWLLCYYTRPVVADRVSYRLLTVEKCENAVQSEIGISIVEATQMIQGVTRNSIEEVRKLNRSSEVVHRIGEAVSLSLGSKNPSWTSFIKLAQDPSALHSRMINYDRSLLTTKLLSRLYIYVSDPQFDPVRVSRVCRTAAELCKWLHGIYEVGRFSFRPWQVDRLRAKESCQTYLNSEKISPTSGIKVPSDDDLRDAVQKVSPLTTIDTFGKTVCS